MDMQPPQAPPALTTTTNEAAVATARRMADAQAWLLTQEAALPTAPEALTSEGLDEYLGQLDAFWETPVTTGPGDPPLPRHDALAARLASLMTDDAELLAADCTLESRALALATAVSRSGGVLPATVHARELLVGQVAYAGALVVTDDGMPDLALLFSPVDGWQAFAGIDALHSRTEQRMRERMSAFIPLPGVVVADIENVIDTAFVSSRAVEGNPFDAMVQRMRVVQEDQVSVAWITRKHLAPALAADDPADNPAYVLPDVTRAAGLLQHVDVTAMMDARNERLQESIVDERLARAPAEAAPIWRAARDAHDRAVAELTASRAADPEGDIEPLGAFVDKALRKSLKALGIPDDPRLMEVQVHRAAAVPPEGRPPHAPSSTPLNTTTLYELALHNLPARPVRDFHARGADGRDLSAVLGPDTLPRLIRDMDVAGTYRAYLKREFETGENAEARRAVSEKVQLARLSLALEDTHVDDWQPGARRSFALGHDERGYRMARALADAMATGATSAMVDGHAVAVSQVLYKGDAVQQVFVFAAVDPNAMPEVVIYTPDAPDGQTFRQYANQAAADEAFFYRTGFEEYLLDQLPPSAAAILPGDRRRFAVSHTTALSDFALNRGKSSGTQTDEPFVIRTPAGSLMTAWYATSLKLIDAHVASVAMTASEVDAPFVYSVDYVARSISAFLGRPFQASLRASDALKLGDYTNAFLHATEAYVSGVDLAGMGLGLQAVAKPVFIRAVGRTALLPGATAPVRRLTPSGVRLPQRDLIAEPRFVARDVSLTRATSVEHGVYTVGGKPYIASGGKVYGIRFDATGKTWRLDRADGSPLTASSPLRRGPDGLWRIDRQFGLPGGAPPGRGQASGPGRSAAAQSHRRGNASLGELLTGDGTRRQVGQLFRLIGQQLGPEAASRAYITAAFNLRIGRPVLRGLHAEELAAAVRDIRQLRNQGPAPRPSRHSLDQRTAVRANPPGVIDLSRLTRTLPVEQWPGTLYVPVLRRHISAAGLELRQMRMLHADGFPAVAGSRPYPTPAAPPGYDMWVAINTDRIRQRLTDPVYRGFTVQAYGDPTPVPGINPAPQLRHLISSDMRSPTGLPAVLIQPGDFTVVN